MSKTVLATSLQSVLQDPTVAAAAAVGLVAVLGLTLWALRGSVLTSDDPAGEPISDGGTTGFADNPSEQRMADAAKANGEDASDEELEHRLDELETEVDGLSSTVKTVRNENEQISKSVQDIEENTGRLLNLYQKAIRGVNPFASETEAADSAVVQHSTDDEKSFDKKDEIEEIETNVTDDSAADLFDSGGTEIREEHCVDSVEEVVDSGNEPDDAFQRSKQAAETESTEAETKATEEVEEVDEDSFEAVFETKTPEGSTETADDDGELFGTEEMIDADGENLGLAASDGGQLIEPQETESDSANMQTDSPETTTSTDQTADATAEPTAHTETAETAPSTAEPTELAEPTEPKETDTETPPTTQSAGDRSLTGSNLAEGKPYVDSLPEGFSTEVMTVEWLEFLVDEVGIRGTIRALEYYETIGWLTEEAVAELDEYLGAFEEPSREELSVEHHLRSLDYVEELEHASED